MVECLSRLAKVDAVTIVTTIHQPRSNIYGMFDKLLLLAKGKTVRYYWLAGVAPPPFQMRDLLMHFAVSY